MLRVLIADNHPLFRVGLRHLVAQLDAAVTVAEAGCLSEAQQLAGSHDGFDLLLIGLRMPGMDDGEGLRALKMAAPNAPLVVFSGNASQRDSERSLAAGAAGFIPKSATLDVTLNALKRVMRGEICLPSSLMDGPRVAAEKDEPTYPAKPTPRAFEPTPLAPLTQRQHDVFALLGQGKSNRSIADSLSISEGTVKVHVGAILKLLGAHNRTQAALMAINAGIAPTQRPANDKK